MPCTCTGLRASVRPPCCWSSGPQYHKLQRPRHDYGFLFWSKLGIISGNCGRFAYLHRSVVLVSLQTCTKSLQDNVKVWKACKLAWKCGKLATGNKKPDQRGGVVCHTDHREAGGELFEALQALERRSFVQKTCAKLKSCDFLWTSLTMLLVDEDDAQASLGKVLTHDGVGHLLHGDLVKVGLDWFQSYTWNTPTKGGFRPLWTLESSEDMVCWWPDGQHWQHVILLSGFVHFNPHPPLPAVELCWHCAHTFGNPLVIPHFEIHAYCGIWLPNATVLPSTFFIA